MNGTLDPIRLDDGTVGDGMPSGDVEVVQTQEEIMMALKMPRQARRPKRK